MPAVAHKQKWKILEVFVVTHIICASILEAIFPLSNYFMNQHSTLMVFGFFFLVLSIGLILRSRKDFRIHSQPTNPGFSTTELITSGTFSITRNPLTIGCLVFLISLGLILLNIWFSILLLPTAFLIYIFLINPEEKYLLNTFGNKYEDYCMKVPRWIII